MATTEEIVTAFGDAWNEADESKRRELLALSWADEGRFVDPQSDVTGREALLALISGFQKRMAGARIDGTSGVQVHHDKIRFNWKLIGADGKTMIEGLDFGELAEDGRIRLIVGFWGDPPPAS